MGAPRSLRKDQLSYELYKRDGEVPVRQLLPTTSKVSVSVLLNLLPLFGDIRRLVTITCGTWYVLCSFSMAVMRDGMSVIFVSDSSSASKAFGSMRSACGRSER